MDFDWTKLIAPAVGALVASQGGSKETKPTVTTVNPYAPAQPHINAVLEQAAKLYPQQASMPAWLQGLYNQGFGQYQAVQSQKMPTIQNLGIGSALDWNSIGNAINYKRG